MGNVAILLQKLGYQVSGTDTGIYPPMSTLLENSGIELFEGYDATRLEYLNIDLVVVGNVISRGNEEVEWLLDTKKIPFTSLPNLIGNKLLNKRRNIVITGTHGKTTTSTLAAYISKSTGNDPGFLIGGVPKDLKSGSENGDKSSPFIIEGDEYDSAFFDKRSKFIHYQPHILTINNLEFDHADIFRDLQDVKRTFNHVLRIVPKNGFVLYNGDDKNIKSLLPITWTTTVSIGTEVKNDLVIKNFKEDRAGSQFSLYWKNEKWTDIKTSLSGLFNARNIAMAGLAVALERNPTNPRQLNLDCIKTFKGVKRRQEILFESENLIIFEDFAHHPTAVNDVLISLKQRFPDFKLITCFEPRSNTACKSLFQEAFTNSLSQADEIHLGAVHRGDNLSDKLDTDSMVKALQSKGKEAQAHIKNSDLLQVLAENSQNSDDKKVICFLSNGSFDGIIQKFTSSVS